MRCMAQGARTFHGRFPLCVADRSAGVCTATTIMFRSPMTLPQGTKSTNVGPYNLRFKDQEGGTMKIGTNDLFTQPWNTDGWKQLGMGCGQ